MAQPNAIASKPRWFARKSEWAEAKAAGIRSQIEEAANRQIPSSNWRGIQRKMQLLTHLRAEESTWTKRANYYRAQGM